jgi:hypothetical protein
VDLTTIVVPDAAATPVNHTFNPSKVDGDTAFLTEKSAATSLGHWVLSLMQRAPLIGQKDKVYRTRVALAIPVTYDEVINGVTRPTLGYTNRATVEFIVSDKATLQNRKDLRKILVGVLNDASVLDMVENQNNLY